MVKISDKATVLTERYGLSPDEARNFVDAMFDVVKENLEEAEQTVKIKGLGTFKVATMNARASVDVNTGERITIEERNKITFSPEVMLRDRVNRPFVQFETVVLNDGVDFSDIDKEFELDQNDDENESTLTEAVDDGLEQDSIEETAQTEDETDDNKTVIGEEPPIIAEENHVVTEGPSVTNDSEDSVFVSDGTTDTKENTNVSVEEQVSINQQPPTSSQEPTTTAEQSATDSEQSTVNNQQSSIEEEQRRLLVQKIMAQSPEMMPSCKQRNPRLMYWLTAASFVLLVAIGVGMYFIYTRIEAKNIAIEQLNATMASAPIVTQKPENTVKPQAPQLESADTIAKNKDELVKVEEAAINNDSKGEDVVKTEGKKSAESVNATSYTDYNFDPRVRTGAYVIVGVEQIVTVRNGQTLQSISKYYLGDGMECYVEAMNGKTEVKAGDKLRIPKLKLKPRKH